MTRRSDERVLRQQLPLFARLTPDEQDEILQRLRGVIASMGGEANALGALGATEEQLAELRAIIDEGGVSVDKLEAAMLRRRGRLQ